MRILIRTGALIDGTDSPPLSDGALLVEDGVIVSAGPSERLESELGDSPPAREVDLRPYWVLPGLIDAHVHLFGSPEPRALWLAQYEPDAWLAVRTARNARSALRAGLTTLRDCGGRASVVRAVARAIDEGTVPGPRLLHSGAPITTTGGHCYFFGDETEGVDELRRAVREHHKAGVDFIKVMVTGGNLTPGSNTRAAQYSQAELQAVADDAHRLGYRTAGHVHGTEGIRRAVQAGFDTLEHCSWLAADESQRFDYVPALVNEIVERGIYVCRTCAGGERVPMEEASREHRLWNDYGPFRRMVQAGVKLIAGSDAGVRHTPFSDLVYTLETMAYFAEMRPADVLASATRLSAKALGLGDEIGTLTVGKRADLIAVRGNPLDDLRVLRQVEVVMRDGEVLCHSTGDESSAS